MRVKRAGAVEFVALNQQPVALAQQPGAALKVARSDLGQGIAKAVARQRQSVEMGALLRVADRRPVPCGLAQSWV